MKNDLKKCLWDTRRLKLNIQDRRKAMDQAYGEMVYLYWKGTG